MKENYFTRMLAIFILLIILIKADNTNYTKEDILYKSEKQGFNISNPNDNFYNDICQYYSIKENKDVSLEYRRKYYYYPNGQQLTIDNEYKLDKIFPKANRENVFLCFNQNFNIIYILNLNKALFFLLPFFIFQMIILNVLICGRYIDASDKTPEEYFEYFKRKKIKKIYNNDLVFKISSIDNINQLNLSTDNNNNTNTFQTLHEEENNNTDLKVNSIDNIIREENIKENKKNKELIIKDDTFISQTLVKVQGLKDLDNNKNEEETKKDDLNTTGDFQHSLDEENEIKDNFVDNTTNSINNEDKEKDKNKKKNINPDELYTFGGLKLDGISNDKDKDKNKEKEKEDSYENKKIIENETKKAENAEYVFNKINNKKNFTTNIKTKIAQEYNLSEDTLTNEELFYSGFSVAILKDKRTFREIYYDILCHCQLFFYLLPNYYIYEDYRMILVYYTLKIYLYFIILILMFNSNSIINKLYDNEFNFIDIFLRCLLATLISNVLSQFIFLLTNSKRMFIRYIGKLNKSLFSKKRIFRYVVKDVIELINNNFLWKIIFFLFMNIILFLIAFFFSVCFCVSYYNTQFLIYKCILICILISQIVPFFLVIIPAKLRQKAVMKKSNTLYIFAKAVESYFLP